MGEMWHESVVGLELEGVNCALICASDPERDFRHGILGACDLI